MSRAAARAARAIAGTSIPRNRVKYPLVRGAAAQAVARGARHKPAAGRGLGLDRREPGASARATPRSRPWRLRALDLGRGERDHRRRQRLYRQEIRARPRDRLLADPGDVDGLLRRRLALSVAARRRLHVFYDWYCDLPPASPQTWGEQTDVPESADWYNAGFLMLWGSNVPQTRTPDAHFYTEARYRGRQERRHLPDYSKRRSSPISGCNPKQGTDAALAMAMGHVILREFHRRPAGALFRGLLPPLHRHADAGAAGEKDGAGARPLLRASDFDGRPRRDQQSRMEDRRLDEKTGAKSSCRTARSASAGARGQMESGGEGRRGVRSEAARDLLEG
jgi:hypothetical protein